MKVVQFLKARRAALALAAALLCLLPGCATSGDDDDVSSMPWNRPTGYESGINPSMMRGR